MSKAVDTGLLVRPPSDIGTLQSSDRVLINRAGNSLSTTIASLSANLGQILQVVSNQITSPTTVSVTVAGTFYDVSGFSASITPSKTTNKVLVLAVIATGLGAGGYYNYIRLVRGSTPIAIGDAGGASQPRISGQLVYQGADRIENVPLIWLDSPNTTSSVTYKIQSSSNSNVVTVFNRPEYDTNVITEPRAPSQILLVEIGS